MNYRTEIEKAQLQKENLAKELNELTNKGKLISEDWSQSTYSKYCIYELKNKYYQVRFSDHLNPNKHYECYLERPISNYPEFLGNDFYHDEEDTIFITIDEIYEEKQIKLLTPINEERYERNGVVVYSNNFITKVYYRDYHDDTGDLRVYPTNYAITLIDEDVINDLAHKGKYNINLADYEDDLDDGELNRACVTSNLDDYDKKIANNELILDVKVTRKKRKIDTHYYVKVDTHYYVKDLDGNIVKELFELN